MLNYQKYFYPLQMQAIIGENMMELNAAMKDQAYMQYAQKRYDKMLEDLQGYQKEALKKPDHDMIKHLDLLDKKDLKTTGWLTTPLDNVDHDFVSPLLNAYLKDIEKRMARHDNEESGMAANLRKATRIADSEEMVNIQY